MSLLEKYRPVKLKDVVGNEGAIALLKNLVLEFRKGKSILLSGNTGVGKTASVYALANEMEYNVVEINASDYRSKNIIDTVLKEGSKQASLFSKGKLILIDDVDSFGAKDRGGLQALLKIIKESEWPILLTAIDPWGSKLKGMRRVSHSVEFKTLNYLEIFDFLKKICDSENVQIEETILKNLARKSNGDLRGALNDLESLIANKGEVDDREYRDSIFNALRLVFKGKDAKLLLRAFSNLDFDLDECFLWVDENLPREYNGEDLKRAYEMLSKADVYKGRIFRRQHFGFLVYFNALISAGVGVVKEEKKIGFVDYKRPDRILKLWIAKQKYGKKKMIAEKIASLTHISSKKVVKDFGFYSMILKDKKVVEELELTEDEVNWLEK